MLYALDKFLFTNMYLDCYIWPLLSALLLPKLAGGKIQPAQTQRKVVACQVLLLPAACRFKALHVLFLFPALPFNHFKHVLKN